MHVFSAFLVAAIVTFAPARQPVSTPFASQESGLTSQLCLDRTEDEGVMNTLPSTVSIFSSRDRSAPIYSVTLDGGGHAACVFVFPGRYIVVAASNAIHRVAPGTSPGCKAPPLAIKVGPKERLTFNIWPGISRTGEYTGCWDVLPRGTPQPGNCMVWPNQKSCRPNWQSLRTTS